jgi:hypothetical protein
VTYSGDPASSTKDRVRFLVGDTVVTDEYLTDTEINAVVAGQPVPTWAAAACAEAIAAKLARKCDLTIGATSISLSQRAEAYRDLAARLRAGGGGLLPGGDGTGVPTAGAAFVGGLSRTERDSLAADSDLVPPSFGVGIDDHPSVAGPWDDLDQRD